MCLKDVVKALLAQIKLLFVNDIKTCIYSEKICILPTSSAGNTDIYIYMLYVLEIKYQYYLIQWPSGREITVEWI